jgi:pimeloyl-ACP methyl ester carboxylesterase
VATCDRWGDLNPVLRTFIDGRLFGSVTGSEAPRVLALHGWARTHRDFDTVVGGEGHEPLPALAVDLPGFGASPPPPDAWGAEAYAELVGRVLDDMDSPVVVLGHSFGGRVALHLAVQRPEAVRALVITGAPMLRPLGRRSHVALAYRVTRRLHAMRIVSDGAMEASRQRFGSADYRAAQGVMREILVRAVNETDEVQLDAVRCPVHLVWGGDDTAAPVAVAEQAMTHLAQGDLAVHPGVGHLTPLLIPAALRAAVVACLN